MNNTRIYWLHLLSPTHAGVGRGVGYIDLPIDRDGITGWPIIRGSAFKGVWSDSCAQRLIPNPGTNDDRSTTDRRKIDTLEGRHLKSAFGTVGEESNSNAGALIPTDARLVCLPVRSFRGTFAWATSPLCLSMLHRTLKLAGENVTALAVPECLTDDVAHHASETVLVEGDNIFLEDLDFIARKCDIADVWAEKISSWVFPDDDALWRQQFRQRFVVLPDSAFDFLCETGTEVHTRVRIDSDTKTVADKALWTEESLPAETILAGFIQCDRIFGHNGEDVTPSGLLKEFATQPLGLQIGGKATVGRGQARCIFTETKE